MCNSCKSELTEVPLFCSITVKPASHCAILQAITCDAMQSEFERYRMQSLVTTGSAIHVSHSAILAFRACVLHGRYSNIPRNMRFCNLCNLQSLGDEFHYLFECPFFANDKNLFLKRYFIRRPNTFKMDQLFNSTHIKTILNLVKFCRKITKHFE